MRVPARLLGICSRRHRCCFALFLIGSALLPIPARCADPPAADEWPDARIESALHEVLIHNDLSDVSLLGRTLGFTLKVMEWQVPSVPPEGRVQTQAMATTVPPYAYPYGTSYILETETARRTSDIRFDFGIRSCPDLRPWGEQWHHPAKATDSLSTDAGPMFHDESVRLEAGNESVVLQRTTNTEGLCSYTLTQTLQHVISVPAPPPPHPSPTAPLLKQLIDLVAAGDLRDYRTTARILDVPMTASGKRRGRLLYQGDANAERIIPGTDTRSFLYFANDTGIVNGNPLIYDPRPGPRTVYLSLSIDTSAFCISPVQLRSGLSARHLDFRKSTRRDRRSENELETVQQGNRIVIGYSLREACIQELTLDQTTHPLALKTPPNFTLPAPP